jgi:hypothetical protein
MLTPPTIKDHRDVVKFLEKIRPAFLNGEVLYEDVAGIVQSVLTAYVQTKEVTDEKIAKVINDFLKLVTVPGRKPPKTPDLFTGSLTEPLKSRFETNLNYPIDLLILHAIAQSRGQAFYLPKPELSTTARTRRLTRELTKARKKYDITMLKTEKEHIDEEEIRFLELRLTHQEQQGEQQDQESKLAERTSALEHEERKFQQELRAQDALDRLSQRSAELSLREANLSLNKELLTKAPAAIKSQRTTAEQIQQSLESITTQLGSITEVMEEAIEKQTTILLTKSTEISNQIQELAEQNEETSEEFLELFEKLEQQAKTHNQATGSKIQGISRQLDGLTKAQEKAMLPLQQELQSIQQKIQESDETTLEQSTRFHTDLQRIQEAIQKQAAHHQQMTKQHLTEFQNLSKKIDELEGIPDQLDEMLDTLSTGLEGLSKQNQEAFQALGQTMETLLTQNEAKTKKAIDEAVATIETSQSQALKTLTAKFEQLALLIAGRPAGISIEEQIQILRERVITDEEIAAELATYIPVSGAYRIEDKARFDVETKMHEFFRSDRSVMLLMGNSGSGKSTFGHYLERKLWKEYTPGKPIPLFISLPTLDDPVKGAIEEYLQRMGFTKDHIAELKRNHEFQIILDAYDEMGKMQNLYISNRLEQWNAHFVISCRTESLYNLPGYQKYFMPYQHERALSSKFDEITTVPFTDEQINAYIQKYLEINPESEWGNWEDYRHQIDTLPGLRIIIETPFLLRIAMEVMPDIVEEHKALDEEERILVTRAKLYDAFMNRWFIRQEDKLMVAGELPEDGHDIKDDFMEFSQQLAIKMHEERAWYITYRKRTGGRLYGRQAASKHSEFFGDDNPDVILARKGCPIRQIAPGRYAFIHATLQDYFVTKATFDDLLGMEGMDEAAPESEARSRAPRLADNSSSFYAPSGRGEAATAAKPQPARTRAKTKPGASFY